ncbi:hypothetical protein COLO4_20256 [Corchorus olitorius]|uniref:Reverse transcriptase n=1 Tax=Corchorus olitorius TaxID=93759 RepID=A0A1R3J0S7_9ROSI|nr:hypothetical protein COLO4_20256 [Corchorus olitorius]
MGSQQNLEKEKEIRTEIEQILDQEQLLWMQKSMTNWIVKGERNTRFYHTITNKRRARNRITSIKRRDGQSVHTEVEIEKEFLNYFKEVFSDQGDASELQIREALENLALPQFSHDSKQTLEQPFTPQEVKRAAFQINPYKAPGIDGKPGVFFFRNIGT